VIFGILLTLLVCISRGFGGDFGNDGLFVGAD
jgi:hypothetical protein